MTNPKSNSVIRRLAHQNPGDAAARIIELEATLARTRAALEGWSCECPRCGTVTQWDVWARAQAALEGRG